MVKRGQLKIQQMAFMLIAVTLFFVLAGMFVLVLKFSDLKKTALGLEDKNAMLLVSKLANSPEFSCGSAFGTSKINCIDSDKIMMLKNYVQNNKDYEDLWGVGKIQIRKIFPKEGDGLTDIECEGNYPNCNLITIFEKNVALGSEQSTYVTLCRKEVDEGYIFSKCEIALLFVYPEDRTNE